MDKTSSKGPPTKVSKLNPHRILDSLHSAVLVLDLNGIVQFANAAAARILRKDPDQIQGQEVSSVFLPFPFIEQLIDQENKEDQEELALILPGNREVFLGIQVSSLRNDEGETWITLSFHEISELLELRRERDRLLELATVGAVMPTILHELKNPLAAITTSVEVLLEDIKDEELKQQLYLVFTEVRRMKLAFEGIGISGRNLLTSSPAAIDYAIREALGIFQLRAQEAGISFEIQVPNLPLLPLDPSVIRAVIYNLVTNSIHACTKGSTIRIQAGIEDNQFWIGVEDDGDGMEPKVREKCLEMFFTTKSSGSGIGLALCSNSFRNAGGDIQVDSLPGEGARILLSVPLQSSGIQSDQPRKPLHQES
jgi:PAS domain S-box-containing protein